MMDTNPQPGRALVAATNDDELIRVLGNSLYPGARPESIRMVLAWCKATGRDPMKKPIHIVPMKVKDAATGQEQWRDVLMPGIGTYRTDAANSGSYAGIDEPEFGPELTEEFDNDVVTFPAWCRVTVYRIVSGEKRAFAAKEYWVENYASGYQGKGVNSMWKKRRYGQLAKVAEAQALRKAFPDETGQTNTTDEMEGKTFAGETIDGVVDDPKPPRETKKEQHRTIKSDVYETDPETGQSSRAMDETFVERAALSLLAEKNATAWLKVLDGVFAQAPSVADVTAVRNIRTVSDAMKHAPSLIKGRIDDMIALAIRRLTEPEKSKADSSGGPSWDASTNGNGNHPAGSGQMAGTGTSGNHGHAIGPEGNGMQDEIERLARHLESEERREAGEGDGEPHEWLPGDP